jgi:hypothetical protein
VLNYSLTTPMTLRYNDIFSLLLFSWRTRRISSGEIKEKKRKEESQAAAIQVQVGLLLLGRKFCTRCYRFRWAVGPLADSKAGKWRGIRTLDCSGASTPTATKATGRAGIQCAQQPSPSLRGGPNLSLSRQERKRDSL